MLIKKFRLCWVDNSGNVRQTGLSEFDTEQKAEAALSSMMRYESMRTISFAIVPFYVWQAQLMPPTPVRELFTMHAGGGYFVRWLMVGEA